MTVALAIYTLVIGTLFWTPLWLVWRVINKATAGPWYSPDEKKQKRLKREEFKVVAVQFVDQRRKEQWPCARQTAADDSEAVNQCEGRSEGVADDFTQLTECFDGRRPVARLDTEADFRNRLWLRRLFEGHACALSVDAPHRANAGAFFGIHGGREFVAQQPDFAGN